MRLRGNCIIRFRVNFCCTIQNVLVDECQAVALENVIDVNPVDAVMHRWREEVDVSQFLDATCVRRSADTILHVLRQKAVSQVNFVLLVVRVIKQKVDR